METTYSFRQRTQSLALSHDNTTTTFESEKFGLLVIKVNELQTVLDQICDKNDLNLDIDFEILAEALKSDYYGFDYKIPPKRWRSSIGEIMHYGRSITNPIEIYKKIDQENHKTIMNRFKQFCMLNYKWVGNYKKNIPDWIQLEAGETEQTVIRISGFPKKQNIGEYKVVIYNKRGYAAQTINFIIQQKIKMVRDRNTTQESIRKKKISEYIQHQNTNHINGNNNNNNNNNNPQHFIEKFSHQIGQLASIKSTYSQQKTNNKLSMNNLNKLEENRENKRSFFAFEASYNHDINQEDQQLLDFPRLNESSSPVNQSLMRDQIYGIAAQTYNNLSTTTGRRKFPKQSPYLLKPNLIQIQDIGNQDIFILNLIQYCFLKLSLNNIQECIVKFTLKTYQKADLLHKNLLKFNFILPKIVGSEEEDKKQIKNQ